jgi:hypothetical protein
MPPKTRWPVNTSLILFAKIAALRRAIGRSFFAAVMKSVAAANLKFLSAVPRFPHRNFKFGKPR